VLGVVPLIDSGWGYVSHVAPMALATEIWLLVVNTPYNDRRGRQRRPIRALWQMRIMWTGLAPIYIKATVQALSGGPRRKPVYKVTRKHHDPRWHWRHTLPQTTLLLAVLCVAIYAVRHGTLPSLGLLLGTVYWGGLNIVLLAGFICRGWHGMGEVSAAVHHQASTPAPGLLTRSAAEPPPRP
jgi:cellulose synthase (UDP-forming)